MTVHDVLVAAGIPVVDARVAARPGSFAPIGVMVHHTGNKTPGDLPSRSLLQKGRQDLPGPLCQIGMGRMGTVAVICDGRANHAGRGSSLVADRVRLDLEPGHVGADDTDGNSRFIGIEIENNGTDEPYTATTRDALLRVCVALCVHYGWSANRVIGHKEWTRRKPDPRFDMGALRADIAAILNPNGDDDMAFGPDQEKQLAETWARVKNLEAVADRDINTLGPKIAEVLAAVKANPQHGTGDGDVDPDEAAKAVIELLAEKLAK